jgi:hypothetical protein
LNTSKKETRWGKIREVSIERIKKEFKMHWCAIDFDEKEKIDSAADNSSGVH